MDISFWLSIVSLALIIPLGIVTNLLTPRLVSYLEKRKLIKSNRSKEQEVKAYRAIEVYKNGSRDKYVSYIAAAALSIICAIGGATCVLLLAFKVGKQATLPSIDESILLLGQPTVLLAITAFLFFLLSALFIVIIFETERRIERFGEYTADIRKKWGDDAI